MYVALSLCVGIGQQSDVSSQKTIYRQKVYQ